MACFIERPRTTCALGGAIAVINALPGVTLVNHTAIGCGGNLSGAITGGGGNMGEGIYSGFHMPSSAIGEKEVVFGGLNSLVILSWGLAAVQAKLEYRKHQKGSETEGMS